MVWATDLLHKMIKRQEHLLKEVYTSEHTCHVEESPLSIFHNAVSCTEIYLYTFINLGTKERCHMCKIGLQNTLPKQNEWTVKTNSSPGHHTNASRACALPLIKHVHWRSCKWFLDISLGYWILDKFNLREWCLSVVQFKRTIWSWSCLYTFHSIR
jgi:hypothetical protein